MELGIVLSVIGVLLATIAVSTVGMYRAARAQRTGRELSELSKAAADALRRNLVVSPGPIYSYKYNGVNSVQVSASTPVCYDLTRFGGSNRICTVTGRVEQAWSSPYAAMQPVPPGSPLLAMLGGGRIYSNGFSAWCMPYAVCLYPFRAEVLTCVPPDDINAVGLAGAQRCGTCGTRSPVSNEPTVCVLVASSTFRGDAATQLRFSYAPQLYDFPTPPATYQDRSPRY